VSFSFNFKWGILVLVLLILFGYNSYISLWDQDEAAYAGFAMQMLNTGDWIEPQFFWSEIHRKTPLYFWWVGLNFKLFCVNHFALRLSSVLSVLITLSVLYFLAKKKFGESIGFLACAILAGSFLIVPMAKIAVTDATLLACSTLAVYFLDRVLTAAKLKDVVLFWVFVALGLLTKGPPILLFLLVFIALLLLFDNRRKNLISLHPWFFGPLAFAPLIYWGYISYQKDGGVFVQWLIDWYILKRVGGSVLGQSGIPGTHLLTILLCFLPFWWWLPSLYTLLKKQQKERDSSILFVVAWFVAGWFLYEWTPSKLPTYVLTAHVPFALLLAIGMSSSDTKTPAIVWRALVSLLLSIVGLAIIALPIYFKLPLFSTALIVTSGIALLVLLLFIFKQQNKQQLIAKQLVFALALQLSVWCVVIPQIDHLRNATRQTAALLASKLNKEAPIYIGQSYGRPPSLPFYLMQHFRHVSEETSVENLLNQYLQQTEIGIILSKEQFEALAEKTTIENVKQLSSLMTDRKEKADYYVVWKGIK
jgi:4-amino-4-deoxy-L-arabinose transferase-like glycosyltransferase